MSNMCPLPNTEVFLYLCQLTCRLWEEEQMEGTAQTTWCNREWPLRCKNPPAITDTSHSCKTGRRWKFKNENTAVTSGVSKVWIQRQVVACIQTALDFTTLEYALNYENVDHFLMHENDWFLQLFPLKWKRQIPMGSDFLETFVEKNFSYLNVSFYLKASSLWAFFCFVFSGMGVPVPVEPHPSYPCPSSEWAAFLSSSSHLPDEETTHVSTPFI